MEIFTICPILIMTEPFYFTNGQLAYNADDLMNLCRQFPGDGIYYLMREDLEKWLAYIGNIDLAQCATKARQATVDDRQRLEKFLSQCQSATAPATPNSKTTHPEVTSPSTKKTSFFRAIAKLFVKIFYKN